MNMLLENKSIEELPCGQNFAYVLNDNGDFLPTEYKVLQNLSNSYFVPCMKMLYNGKIELYYLTAGYTPFSELLPSLNAEGFLAVCLNLFSDINSAKNHGFLLCQSIDISFQRIYVDRITYKVSLIYLPTAHRLFYDMQSFENELRSSLIRLIQGTPALMSPNCMQFMSNLANSSLTLDNLLESLRGRSISSYSSAATAREPGRQAGPAVPAGPRLKLVLLNSSEPVEFIVAKPEFTIGKRKGAVDGLVTFNKAISRLHCRINREGGRFTVTDLGSANGTYVNMKRLQENVPCPIQSGDILRLANSDFQVQEG